MKLAIKKPNFTKPSDFSQWLFVAWFASSLVLTPNELCQIFFPPIFQLIFLLLFLSVLGVTFTNQSKIKLKFDGTIKLFLSGVVIYLLGLTLAIGTSNDPYYSYSLYIFVNRANIFFSFVIALLKAEDKLVKRCMDIYSNFLMVLAIMSVILFFLVAFVEIPSIGSYTGFGDRTYRLYPLGLAESVAGFGDVVFPRAQSFYKEPGNFAMMLIPSLIWVLIGNYSFIKSLVFFITILLTFSVAGWLTVVPVLALIFFKIQKSNSAKFKKYKKIFFIFGIISGLILGLMLFLAFSFVSDSDWLTTYIFNKFLEEEGSGGERVQNYLDAYEIFLNHPQGIGPGELVFVRGGFTLPPVFYQAVEAGVLGALGYAVMIFTMLGLALYTLIKSKTNDETMIALAASSVALFCMSFQRGEPFGGYTTMMLCSFFFRCYIDRKTVQYRDQLIKPKNL